MPTKSTKSEGRTRSKSPARSARSSRSRSRSRSRGRSPGRPRKAKQSPSPARKTRVTKKVAVEKTKAVEKTESKSETAQTATVQKTEVVKRETVTVTTPTRQSSETTPTRHSARIAAIQHTKETGTVTTVKTESLELTKKRAKATHYEFGGPVGALVFMILMPVSAIYARLECNRKDCSLAGLRHMPTFPKTLDRYFDVKVAGVVLGFVVVQAVIAILPVGRVVEGQALATGKRLKYRCNGFFALLLSVGLCGALVRFGGVPSTYLLDHWIHFITAATILSVLMSICAFVRSRKADKKALTVSGNTGNVLNDFFMGRELNPRIFGGRLDLKMFFMRVGLIAWALVNLGFLLKAYQTSGSKVDHALVLIVASQLLYILDVLWFEDGILTTMDILHEGHGYMLTAGMMIMPFFYSLHTLYIFQYPKNYNAYKIAGLVALNIIGYVIFRGSNSQKNQFRKNPYDPALSHLESLPTPHGKRLLVSGWWGLCRHPNYLGDLILALAWSLTCGLTPVLPHLFFVYLLTLLVHRGYRASATMHKQYGPAWDRYCQRVPYRILPYVY